MSESTISKNINNKLKMVQPFQSSSIEEFSTDEYKILIQQKFNRKKKTKTKYLTPNLIFSERENEALEFNSFQEAEDFLNNSPGLKNLISKPRIIIKYIGDLRE